MSDFFDELEGKLINSRVWGTEQYLLPEINLKNDSKFTEELLKRVDNYALAFTFLDMFYGNIKGTYLENAKSEIFIDYENKIKKYSKKNNLNYISFNDLIK